MNPCIKQPTQTASTATTTEYPYSSPHPDLISNSLSENFFTEEDHIPKNVMVVEDSLMLAIDMSDMLKQIGIVTVEKCPSVSQAKRVLSQFTPDITILDINLRGEQSFEIAYTLKEKDVPFCFATGYGVEFPIPNDLKAHITLKKPVKIKSLRSAIKTIYK